MNNYNKQSVDKKIKKSLHIFALLEPLENNALKKWRMVLVLVYSLGFLFAVTLIGANNYGQGGLAESINVSGMAAIDYLDENFNIYPWRISNFVEVLVVANPNNDAAPVSFVPTTNKVANNTSNPQVFLTLSADKGEIRPGGVVTYTIYIVNNGTDMARELRLITLLSSRARLVGEISDNGYYDKENHALKWDISSLSGEAGGNNTVIRQFQVQIN